MGPVQRRTPAVTIYLATVALAVNACFHLAPLFVAADTPYALAMTTQVGIPIVGAVVLALSTLALHLARPVSVLLVAGQVGATALGVLPTYLAGLNNIGAGLLMLVSVPLLAVVAAVTSVVASTTGDPVSSTT